MDRDVLRRMRTLLRHRGPDDEGEYFDDRSGLALGHTRLSIIDLAGGHQPIANEDGTVQAVFNGEIYNFAELRRGLAARGHVLRTRTDTEVLVHLYEEKGERLVEDLVGDFAFALWDAEARSLLLARDRLGVKPLYYCDCAGKLVFASTLPALLCAAEVPRRIDPQGLLCYLTFQVIQAPLTIYRDVHKLPPGHVLTAQAGAGVRVRPYWDLELTPDETRDPAAVSAELEAQLEAAVRGQLVSDVPLGAFLSGGVDSSTVVHFMHRGSREQVKTFSIGFAEPQYDESDYYRPVARRYGVEHRELLFKPELLDDARRVVRMFGEPCSIGSAFPLYHLARLAAQHVKVVLSGDGPDEIFAGYDLRYRYLALLRRLGGVCPAFVARATSALLSPTQRLRTTGPWGNALRRARKALETLQLPRSQWVPHWMLNRTSDTSPRAILHRDLAIDADRPLPYVEAFERCAADGDWMRPFLYADIRVVLPSEMFTRLDAMTMAHSIEGRVPLCDHRIVELAGRIPSRLKFDAGRGKCIFRQAVGRHLPPETLQRPKAGFRVPLNEWFRGPLKPMAKDLLDPEAIRSAGLFDERAVERIVEAHLAGRQQYGGVLWSLTAFELWRREVAGG